MKTKVRQFLKDSKGYTLIEMLVVVLAMGFLITALYDLLDAGTRNYSFVDRGAQLNQTARTALNKMVATIREGDSVTLSSTNSSYLRVNKSTGNTEYILEGTNLKEKSTVTSGFEILEKNISSLNFSSGAGISPDTTVYPADSFVRIELTASSGGQQYSVRTAVYVPYKP